jgi:hypothetical protein
MDYPDFTIDSGVYGADEGRMTLAHIGRCCPDLRPELGTNLTRTQIHLTRSTSGSRGYRSRRKYNNVRMRCNNHRP